MKRLIILLLLSSFFCGCSVKNSLPPPVDIGDPIQTYYQAKALYLQMLCLTLDLTSENEPLMIDDTLSISSEIHREDLIDTTLSCIGIFREAVLTDTFVNNLLDTKVNHKGINREI